MTSGTLFLILLIAAVAGFALGRGRALALVGGKGRALHSRPQFYGAHVFILTFAPAAVLLLIWMVAQPLAISARISAGFPDDAIPEGRDIRLVMTEVRTLADGLDRAVAVGAMTRGEAADVNTDIRGRLAGIGIALGGDVRPSVLAAAQDYRTAKAGGTRLRGLVILAVAAAGFLYALWQIHPAFRARIAVETAIRALLMACASIAILTTVGIVLSLLFNTIQFLKIYPWQAFFFGLTWQPSFQDSSALGILPLLWGTFYISLVALVVAVPIGLFAAVYLSEYAPPAVRTVAKPMLEVLAGIPTIVYGLFALLTVGPLLVSAFGKGGLLGVEWMGGGTAVMTAGLVMGIMLIPFVSSLSDDIITAVPQTLRDGSLGLGATRSETVKLVVLPAALPGIVGAVLLAASRAIGETMIVVLGAGAAARLDLNPFAAMTTVTAKIVSQLTGDSDFNSPEALVAFALSMTLFVVTLLLNMLALRIVRKYREQYE